MGRRSSVVWKFFRELNGENGRKQVVCTICHGLLAYMNSPGSMSNHLRLKHGEIFQKYIKKAKNANVCLNSPPTSDGGPVQESLLSLALVEDVPKSHSAKLATMCTIDLQPLSFVEGRGFKEFLKEIHPVFEIPERRYVKRCLDFYYQQEKQALIEKLSEEEGLCLSVDLWSSVTAEEYFTLAVHFINENWELNHSVLATRRVDGHFSGHNLGKTVSKTLTEFSIGTDKVCGFISENATCMVNCADNFGWSHFNCFGQTLQLAICGAFEQIKLLSSTVLAAKALISLFNNCNVANMELKEQLRRMEMAGSPLTVVNPSGCFTTFEMFECLLRNRQSIYDALRSQVVDSWETPSDDQWRLIETMVPVFRPLYIAIRIMCSEEYPCLSGVYPMLCSLRRQHLQVQEADMEAVAAFKRRVVAVFDNYSNRELCEDPALICTFLDPRYKSLPFLEPSQRDAIKEKVACHLQKESPLEERNWCPPSPKRSRLEDLQSDMAFLLGEYYQHSDSATPEEEIRQYAQGKMVPTAVDHLAWWRMHAENFPNLARMARRWLCIPATAVPAKRVFSAAEASFVKRRAALEADCVDELLFLNSTTRLAKDPSTSGATATAETPERDGDGQPHFIKTED